MGLGLVDGAGEARCIHHYSSNDYDQGKTGSGQPDVIFFHSSSLKVVRISFCSPDALLVHVGKFVVSLQVRGLFMRNVSQKAQADSNRLIWQRWHASHFLLSLT